MRATCACGDPSDFLLSHAASCCVRLDHPKDAMNVKFARALAEVVEAAEKRGYENGFNDSLTGRALAEAAQTALEAKIEEYEAEFQWCHGEKNKAALIAAAELRGYKRRANETTAPGFSELLKEYWRGHEAGTIEAEKASAPKIASLEAKIRSIYEMAGS